MIKIGICDDELAIHNQVKKYILDKDFGEKIEIVSFLNGADLLEYGDTIDILLLDIVMPEIDGIDVGRLVSRQKNAPKIIMLTSMRERFKEAFEISAYRFVTKPIVQSELIQAILDAVKTFVGNSTVEVYRDSRKYGFQQKQIVYISKVQSRTEVIIGEKAYQSMYSLEEWEAALDERIFFRVHKSYIVNFSYIDRIEDKIYLTSEEVLPVAKRRKNALMQRYIQYDLEFR